MESISKNSSPTGRPLMSEELDSVVENNIKSLINCGEVVSNVIANTISNKHYVKSGRIQSFSGLYFLVFGLKNN